MNPPLITDITTKAISNNDNKSISELLRLNFQMFAGTVDPKKRDAI